MNRKPTKQVTKGVSHLRVSAPGQRRSGLGIASQRSIIKYFFKVNNIILVKEFVEYGSGRPRKRPKAQKTIDYCRKHNLTLYVAYQSRLARNLGFICDLEENGFKFINIESPNADKYQKYFQGIIDEKTGDDISRNTKNALISARKKGVVFGGNSKKRKKTLEKKRKDYLKYIKPIVLAIQKDGFHTVRDITTELIRRRAKNYRGKRGGFLISTVHKILNDLKTKTQ